MVRLHRFTVLLVLAVLVVAGGALMAGRAEAEGADGDVHVLARLAEGRRVEFGLQAGGEVILPERRFVSLDRGATGWLRSSAVALPDGRGARVAARRMVDGRFEWALRVEGAAGELRPVDRFVPPLRSFSEWLRSGAIAVPPRPCCEDEGRLRLAFFAFFAPLSYSADHDPESPGFHEHRGYEAALIDALEIMEHTGLSFERTPVGTWTDFWLLPAGPEFEIAAGGITILESRRLDHSGRRAIAFSSGHAAVRQTLLVRAADAERIRTHADLTSDDRIGVLAGATGEARLLQLTGLVDEHGTLAAGTRIETASGAVTADGSAAFSITAAEQTANVAGRTRLIPPSAGMPQVIYLGDDEAVLIEALLAGRIDGFARGDIANVDAARAAGGALAVTAHDQTAVEWAGFALAVEDAALLACIDARVEWLTDGRRIGYADWAANPDVFRERAGVWNGRY